MIAEDTINKFKDTELYAEWKNEKDDSGVHAYDGVITDVDVDGDTAVFLCTNMVSGHDAVFMVNIDGEETPVGECAVQGYTDDEPVTKNVSEWFEFVVDDEIIVSALHQ